MTTSPTAPAGTKFGYNVYREGSETYTQALTRQTNKLGAAKIARVFYPGLPAAWPGNAGQHPGDVVVSFKASPSEVLSGRLDTQLRNWFATAPRDRTVYWTYFHEPEDDIEAGSFTATDYRAAWRRLDGLADQAGNTRLKATTVMMCWTLAPRSGRNWQNYYAGDDVIDVMGWDCYNTDADAGQYRTPSSMFTAVKAVADLTKKPYGIAEFGSKVATGDDGTRRGAWLRDSQSWLAANRASWVIYFDAPIGGEFRLFDTASIGAWKFAVVGS